jgi:hypothetical protein
VQSCTRSGRGERARDKSYRAFLIVGDVEQRESAQHIITSAVEQYQRLFAGKAGASASLYVMLHARCMKRHLATLLHLQRVCSAQHVKLSCSTTGHTLCMCCCRGLCQPLPVHLWRSVHLVAATTLSCALLISRLQAFAPVAFLNVVYMVVIPARSIICVCIAHAGARCNTTVGGSQRLGPPSFI